MTYRVQTNISSHHPANGWAYGCNWVNCLGLVCRQDRLQIDPNNHPAATRTGQAHQVPQAGFFFGLEVGKIGEEEMMNQERIHKKARAPTQTLAKGMVAQQEAVRLIEQLQRSGMLLGSFKQPKEWMLTPEISESNLAVSIRDHLSRGGWQHVLKTVRNHNRRDEENPWLISDDGDFLAAVRLVLQRLKSPELDLEPSMREKEPPYRFRRIQVLPPERDRRRKAALSRLQVDLEGRRAEALLNHQMLPELLEELYESHPLREGYVRERVRHRVALVVGSVVSILMGVVVGVIESIIDVLINSISNFAPILAPALLVFLVSLLADTIRLSAPADWTQLVAFVSRAVWNGSLAFGVTLLVYSLWHYVAIRRLEKGSAERLSGIVPELDDDSEQEIGFQA